MNSIGGHLFSCEPPDWERLQTQFHTENLVVLPNFLPANLLVSIQRQLASSAFVRSHYAVDHPGSTGVVDEMITDAAWVPRLLLLLNEPRLLERVAELTAEKELLRFSGRLYKLEPNSGQHLDWHSDHTHGKRIAVSINVSPTAFTGGQLQLRRRSTGQLIEHHNIREGDAVLFRIAEDLEHRVLPVVGNDAKFALTGWFFS